MKKNNNKGFTLMEMLIVVAIIAILVAIAIPTFTGSLNKAKIAADEANLRAAYADAMAKYMMDTTQSATANTPALQTSGSASIGGVNVSWETGVATVTVGTDGSVAFSGAASGGGSNTNTNG